MSGMWKRSHGRTSEAPPDERGGYRYVRPTATAPHLDSTRSSRSYPARYSSADVKGFGCRPIRNLTAGTEGRRPKASREGTRGGQRGGCRLWRFDGRAASASDTSVCEGDRG